MNAKTSSSVIKKSGQLSSANKEAIELFAKTALAKLNSEIYELRPQHPVIRATSGQEWHYRYYDVDIPLSGVLDEVEVVLPLRTCSDTRFPLIGQSGKELVADILGINGVIKMAISRYGIRVHINPTSFAWNGGHHIHFHVLRILKGILVKFGRIQETEVPIIEYANALRMSIRNPEQEILTLKEWLKR